MHNIIRIHVSQPWFEHIKNGKKKIEGRLLKGSFVNIKQNDSIEIYNESLKESFFASVHDVKKYDSFYEMIESNGVENVLPGIENTERGVEVYRVYYSEEAEMEFKVLAIFIDVI